MTKEEMMKQEIERLKDIYRLSSDTYLQKGDQVCVDFGELGIKSLYIDNRGDTFNGKEQILDLCFAPGYAVVATRKKTDCFDKGLLKAIEEIKISDRDDKESLGDSNIEDQVLSGNIPKTSGSSGISAPNVDDRDDR